MSWLYLLLNGLTLSVPLLRSFEHRIAFYKKWKALFTGIALTGAFFILWDVYFTHLGVWGFNPKYLIGVDILNLPIEEWLFFVTVPFACMFIYEVLNYFIQKDLLKNIYRPFFTILAILILIIGIVYYDRIYTSVTFILTSVFIFIHLFIIKKRYLSRFLLAYLVSLLPFVIVNGILTGSFIDEQIVWYDDTQNLGIRLFTIPIEDSIYMLLLLMMNVSIYEWKKYDNQT